MESSARPSVGDHDTVRAKGLLENIKWAWGSYRRWSHHSDENRDTLTATRFHGRYPEAIFRDRIRTFRMPTQPFGWPPYVFYILLPVIIRLFPYYY